MQFNAADASIEDWIACIDGDDGNVPGYAISYGCTLVFGNAGDVLLILLLLVSEWCRVGADEKSLVDIDNWACISIPIIVWYIGLFCTSDNDNVFSQMIPVSRS